LTEAGFHAQLPIGEGAMNNLSNTAILIIILIPVIIIVFLLLRMNLKRVQSTAGNFSEFEGGPRNGLEGEVSVIRKKETIAPDAGNIAKVDLIVEVHLPGKDSYQVSTCWLVEIDSLDQLEPGKTLPVKVDSKNPTRVFPNVPWARFWIFGK
jgi:preprotein translocase subunit YajC